MSDSETNDTLINNNENLLSNNYVELDNQDENSSSSTSTDNSNSSDGIGVQNQNKKIKLSYSANEIEEYEKFSKVLHTYIRDVRQINEAIKYVNKNIFYIQKAKAKLNVSFNKLG